MQTYNLYALEGEEIDAHRQQWMPDGEHRPPAGFREISERAFAESRFFTHQFIRTEYRQLYFKDGRYAYAVRLFYFADHTGVAMTDRSRQGYGKVRFFAFGCEHDYRELTEDEARDRHLPFYSGLCCHNLYCDKCGHYDQFDSTG